MIKLEHIIESKVSQEKGVVLKWQRSRMGRPLSTPQTNGKII